MYSFHSSAEEKNKLLQTLAQHGIETTVDRAEKKKRIRDWIQSSVIAEEEEVLTTNSQNILVNNKFLNCVATGRQFGYNYTVVHKFPDTSCRTRVVRPSHGRIAKENHVYRERFGQQTH